MVIFCLAAIAAYIACDPFARLWSLEPETTDAKKQPRAGGIILAARAVVALIAFAVLVFALLVAETDLFRGQTSYYVREVLSANESLEAILGALFGIVWRTFPYWRITAGLWGIPRAIVLGGMLGGLVIVAVLAPHLRRLSTVETPYAKLQFATPQAERQLQVEIQRDLAFYEGLAGVSRTNLIFQYDCAYWAIRNGGLANFKSQQLYKAFQVALKFRHDIVEFLIPISNAEVRGYDVDALKRRVSAVADRFYTVLSSRSPKDGILNAYQAAVAETEAQRQTLPDGILSMSQDSDPRGVTPLDIEETSWCNVADWSLNDEDLKNMIENTRYIYGAVAVMYSYTGNTEGAIKTYELAQAKPTLREDINVTSSLAEQLYIGERRFDDISQYLERALTSVDLQAKEVDQYCARKKTRAMLKIANSTSERVIGFPSGIDGRRLI